jgi:hypothetical protein
MSESITNNLIIFVLVLIFILCACKCYEKFAYLPSDYGLSPMNRSTGFVKPFSIGVTIPENLSKNPNIQQLEIDSSQQIIAQQTPGLKPNLLSAEEIQKLNKEVEKQVDEQVREADKLLQWWKDYSSQIDPKRLSDIYSMSGLLQDTLSIQHFGLSQNHIDTLRLLKNNLQNVPPQEIKTYEDVKKYVAPALIKLANTKLDSGYQGMYKYDWVNVV